MRGATCRIIPYRYTYGTKLISHEIRRVASSGTPNFFLQKVSHPKDKLSTGTTHVRTRYELRVDVTQLVTMILYVDVKVSPTEL